MIDPALTTYMGGLQFFNSETSAAMLNAELYWFFGGVFCAWVLCAFGCTIRAVRAGAGHVDI